MKYEEESEPWRKTFYATATKEWFETIALWHGEEVIVYLCNLNPSPIPKVFLDVVRSSRRDLLRDYPEIQKWASPLWLVKPPKGSIWYYPGPLADGSDIHGSFAKYWVRWMRKLLDATTEDVLGWLWRLNWTRKKVPWHMDMIHSPMNAVCEYLKSAPRFKEREVMPVYNRWLATRKNIAESQESLFQHEMKEKFTRYKEDKKAKIKEEWDRAHPPKRIKPHRFRPRYAVKRRRMYE